MAIFARLLRLTAAAALSVPLAHVQTKPPISIEGDVVDASTGKGIAGARVRLAPPEGDPLFVTADAQGHFLVTGLETSNFAPSAAYPGYVEPTLAKGQRRVQMLSGAPAFRLRLELVRQSVIAGKIIDPVGVPIAGVNVNWMLRSPVLDRPRPGGTVDGDFQYVSAGAVQTNDLGEYRIAAPPGSYYVSAEPEVTNIGSNAPPLDPSERTTFYPHGVKPSEGEAVQVAGGEERRVDIQIVREGGVKVSGRILGTQGGGSQPLSANASALTAGARNWSESDIKDGRFAATDLLPGTYRFYAAEGFSGEDGPVGVARKTVEVGRADLDVDLELEPTVQVTGSVAFENGCSATPVSIQISEQSDRYTYTIQPDAGGVFTLKHVIQGRYKTYASQGTPARLANISVKFGRTEGRDGFDIGASAAGPLRITVSCPEGKP